MPRLLVLGLVLSLLAACSGEEASSAPGMLVCESGCEGNVVSLGSVGVGAKAIARVTLANRGGESITLEGRTQARSFAPFLSEHACNPACSERTLAPGETLELAIGLRPEALGEVSSRLDLGAIVLEVNGQGIAPTVSCTPQEIVFGQVVVGGTERRTASCTNVGPNPTTIDFDRPSGSDAPAYFEVEIEGGRDRTMELAAGETVSFYVSYLPTTEGDHIATMDIRAGEELIRKLMLEGEGIASALLIEPRVEGCHDFGYVAPGGAKDVTLQLRNPGVSPVRLESKGTTSGAFVIVEAPSVVAGGTSAELKVRFLPDGIGPYRADVRIVTDASGTQPSACVGGIGGGPRLVCDVDSFDFGQIYAGASRTDEIRCTNEGWENAVLHVESVSTTGPFSASVRGGFPAAGVAKGESFFLDVTFEPGVAGVAEGSITFVSNDSGLGAKEILLAGEARDVPPCNLQVPDTIDFGNVSNRVLTVDAVVRNVGEQDCELIGLRTLGRGFRLDGPEALVVPVGGSARIPVSFVPSAISGGGFLEIGGNFFGSPTRSILLLAQDEEPSVVAAPVDFGAVATGCASEPREMTLWPITGAVVHRASVIGPFEITDRPDVQPDGSYLLAVRYVPEADGEDFGALVVETSMEAGDDTLLVPLRGRSNPDAVATESFGGRPIDVLYVADNSSTSMVEAVEEWGSSFLDPAQSHGLDFQLGVTTTGITPSSGCPGGVNGGEDGRLFPVIGTTPRIITPDLSEAEQDSAFVTNGNVGICHGSELGLEAAFRALSPPLINHADDPRHPEVNDGNLGFLRHAADLAVMVISDEEDQSPMAPGFYAAFFQGLKSGGQRVRFHAVVGDRGGCSTAQAGARYIDVAEATSGSFLSQCAAPSEMAGLALDLFSQGACLPLAGTPADPDGAGPATRASSISVIRDGIEEPATRWTYDADSNSVCINSMYKAEPGERFEVTYTASSVCGG